MNMFEMLDEISYLCDTHDIIIEVNRYNLIIRKYYYFDNKPCNYNQAFSFEIFKHKDIEACVLEFEKRLEIEMKKYINN